MFIAVVIIIVIIIITLVQRKRYRRTHQVGVTTPPQASAVRYCTRPSIIQQTPQQSAGASNVPQHAADNPCYYNTEHAAVGSTANSSILMPAINKTNGSPSNYPQPPPYDAYCYYKECTPGEFHHNQSTSVPPPDYSSVVSTSASVPVPPATNI